MIHIGLAGNAGTGKDEVANYLVSHYGFIKYSFSDFLYAEVAEAFGLPDESLLRDRETKEVATPLLAMRCCFDGGKGVDYGFKSCVASILNWDMGSGVGVTPEWDKPISPRQALQWWGTEFRRAANPNYWIERADEWIGRLRHLAPYPELRHQRFVNTSVRFENEREFIMSRAAPWDANIWHLRREAAKPVSSHVSETPLPVLEGEREIFNNYTLEYIHKGVDQLLTSGARFVRLEPPAPMVEPPLPGGQYYSVQADGHRMLCNADGTRSIFDDVDG